MRIKPEQLESALSKQILPIYLVSGDEPLLVQEVMDSLRAHLKKNDYLERKVFEVDRYFDWNMLLEDAGSLSLFAEKKVTELRLGKSKPGAPGSKALLKYCEQIPDDIVLLIECAKLDGGTLKSKWVQTLEKHGALIQIWPVGLNEMPRWLSQRARKTGLNLNQEATSILSNRLEGNLLAAQQELEKLKLLHGEKQVTAEMIESEVMDASRYDIFDLTDACINGKAQQALKILSHLKLEGNEITKVLWAVTRELRLLTAIAQAKVNNQAETKVFSKFRVIPRRQSGIQQAAKRHSAVAFSELLSQCKRVDDAIKGAAPFSDPWQLLSDITLKMTQADRH